MATAYNQKYTGVINLDPVLFERSHWNARNPDSAMQFQTFCGLFLSNLRHHTNEIPKAELDAFVALVRDSALLLHVHYQLVWLQDDLYGDEVR